jgi:hypothetical protein
MIMMPRRVTAGASTLDGADQVPVTVIDPMKPQAGRSPSVLTVKQHTVSHVEVEGGTAARVLEFANADGPRRGGRDPEVPQLLTQVHARGRLLVGHTWDLGDPDAPIWTDPRDTIWPGQMFADLRCPGCVSKVHFGQFGPDATMAAIGHERGCRWLTEMLQLSGITP